MKQEAKEIKHLYEHMRSLEMCALNSTVESKLIAPC